MRRLVDPWQKIDLLDLHSLSWRDGLVIAILLGLALDWRLCHYTWKGIWLDESFSLMTALMDNPILTITYRNMDNNPALFEFILHFVAKKIGYELYIIRLPSVIFSTLAVYFIYRILRDLEGVAAGLVAGLLYGYQNYSVTYSHEVRAYALLGLFTAMALWGFLRWMGSPSDQRFLITTLLGSLGAAYTHNFGLWVIISQVLSVLSVPSVRKALKNRYRLYLGLFLLAYAPQGILTGYVFLSGMESWAPRPGWADWSYLLTYWLNGATHWIYYGQAQAKDWLSLSVMALTTLALLRAWILNKNFEKLFFLIFSNFSIIFMYFLLSHLRSCWLDRYLMPASIGFLVMLVAVVFSFSGAVRLGLLAGLGWIFSQGAHSYSLPNLSTEGVVARLKELNPRRRYALFISPPYLLMPVLYHYDRNLFRESAREALDPFEKMRDLSEQAHIWATEEYNARRPCWFEAVDTALVLIEDRNSPFLKALEAEFMVSEQPLYEEPHLPVLLWAYRRDKVETARLPQE